MGVIRFLVGILFLIILFSFFILFTKFTSQFFTGPVGLFFGFVLAIGSFILIIYFLASIADLYWSKKKVISNNVKSSALVNFLIGINILQKNEKFEEWKNLNIGELNTIAEKCDMPLDDFFGLSLFDNDFLGNFNKNIELNLLIEDFMKNSSFEVFKDSDAFSGFDMVNNFNNLNEFVDFSMLNNSYESIDFGIDEFRISINPATGLPIFGDSGIDVGGNPDGINLSDTHDSMSNIHDYHSSNFDNFNDRF